VGVESIAEEWVKMKSCGGRERHFEMEVEETE
jgi:hypothetical protein